MDGQAERMKASGSERERVAGEEWRGFNARQDMAAQTVPTAVWRLFTMIWLLFLFYPIQELLQAHLSLARTLVGFAGMVTFVGIYLWLMLHEPFRDTPLSPAEIRLHVALIATLTTIVLLLTRTYSIDWLWFIMYANMSSAIKLPVRAAAPTIVSLTVLTIIVGRITEDWAIASRIVSPVAAVAVVMIGISRLVVTIRELRAARQEIARLAVADERLRFARDVHDLLGHSLSTIAIKAALARRLLPGDPERAMHELDDVQAVTQAALHEVREAVTGYRQPALATELVNAREILGAAGIACQCEETAGTLPPAVESVVAWAVREGVTNIVRHSHARHVTIRIQRAADAVSADIIDDGDGSTGVPCTPSSNGGGNGLRGLAERAAAVGGRIEAGPCATGGFHLCATLPMRNSVFQTTAVEERAR